MDDDKKRLLKIVNASNPSIRERARPATLQIQGTGAYTFQNKGNVNVQARNQSNEAGRLVLNQPQQAKLKVSTPYDPELWRNNKTSPAGIPNPTPPPRPQQSFWNKARDIFDANTDADRYRRQVAGLPEMYQDEQLVFGNSRPAKNFGDMVLGNTARLVNTAKAGIGGIYGLALLGKESVFGTDQSYQRRLGEVQGTLNRDLLNEDGGLFGAGTVYNADDDPANLSTGELARKTVGAGVGTAGEILPFFKGTQVLRIAGRPFVTGGLRFAQGALEGAAGEFGYQAVTQDEINTKAIAISALFGGSLNVASGSFYDALANRRAGSSAVSRQIARNIAETTDRDAIRLMVRNELGITGDVAEELVDDLSKLTDVDQISRAIDETVDLIDEATPTKVDDPEAPKQTQIDEMVPEQVNPVETAPTAPVTAIEPKQVRTITLDTPDGKEFVVQFGNEVTDRVGRVTGFDAAETSPNFKTVAEAEKYITERSEALKLGEKTPEPRQPVDTAEEVAQANAGVGEQNLDGDKLIEDGDLSQVGVAQTTREDLTARDVSQQAGQVRTTSGQTAQELVDLARQQETGFVSDIEEVAGLTGGQITDKIKKNAVKTDIERIEKKITDKGGRTPSDLLRSTIIIDNPQQNVRSIVENLRERGYEIWTDPKSGLPDFDDLYRADAPDMDGYKHIAIKFTRGADDPIVKEVIVITPNMYKAKGALGGHKLYKQVRAKIGDWVAAQEQMRKLYADASRFDDVAINSASDTSLPSNNALPNSNGLPSWVYPATSSPSATTLTGTPSTIKNLGKSAADVGDGASSGIDDVLSTQDIISDTGSKTRRGQVSLANDSGVPISVWEDISGYTPITNEATLDAAEKAVKKNAGETYDRLMNEVTQPTEVDVAEMQVLMRDLIDQDKLKEAEQLAKRYAGAGTDAGRAVQQFAALRKSTPTGAIFEANKIIREANERWFGKSKKYTLTKEKKNRIVKLAENAQQYEPGTRERQKAEALLAREVTRVVPASIGEKLATAQTYAQLLNPKTAIRNVGGNAILGGFENVATAVATPVDILMSFSKRSGGRTVSLPNVLKRLGGFSKGGKQGFEDVLLGIRTVGESGQFDIKSDVFQNKVGRALDKALGFELQVPDKAFYMAQFEETLDSVMRAQGVDKPTREMLFIANKEALYSTFQNNSALSNLLSGTKKGLNFGKKFGIGELVLKYPKTPGNIVSVGMDYSPWGFFKGLYKFAKETEGLSAAQQRAAARDVGRGITGSGLIMGGYYLAKNNIITANPSTDRDVNALQRNQSQGAYSINISALQRLMRGESTETREGDIVSNYDWAQPTAIQLSMGASMADANVEAEDKLNAAIESASAGVDTITQQPVIKQTARFIDKATTSADRGGGIPAAVADVAAGAPSSFVPSVLRQTAQVVDPYVRQTYDPNPISESVNRVRAGLPFLSQGLPRYKDSFGQDIERYDGSAGKRIFDSFVNPAFVDTVTRTPEGQMVFDIYNSTGETKQFPRVADKSYTINGEKRDLTAEEYNKYQEYIGTKTQEAFEVLANNPGFMALSDQEKADTMAKLISDIGQAGRIEVLGAEYKSVPNDVKKILNNNVGDFTSKVPEGVDGSVAKHYEEVAFMDDDTYDAWLKGEASATSIALIKELNDDRPEGISLIGDSNEIAAAYAAYKKAQAEGDWTKIEEINKREDMWKDIVKTAHSDVANEIYSIASNSNNELREFIQRGLIEPDDLDAAIELDNALYRSGLNRTLTFGKKFRNEYGYAIPEVVESVAKTRGSSGSGSGRSKKTRANVGGFRLNFNTNVRTQAPDISEVPTRVQFKVDKPSASNVTPVKLKL